jgi:hypothetical protein
MRQNVPGSSARQGILRTLAMLAAPIVVSLAAPFVAPATAGEEVLVDGVLHVRNPAEPPDGVETWRLEELWRVGDRDDELLLGLPTGLGWDAAGRIYILDAQLNQIHILSPDGELLATRSREGDGPGEMRNPSDLIVWPDGRIGVVQEFPGVVIRLAANGDPLPSLHPGGDPEEGGWSVLMRGRAYGEGLVVCGRMTRQDDEGRPMRRGYLAAFDAAGAERFAVIENVEPPRDRSRQMREQDELKPWVTAWDIAPDGRIVTAVHWTNYVLRVVGSDGKVDCVIERDYEPWRRTDADRRPLLRLLGVPEGAPSPIELAEFAPTISLFQCGVQVVDSGEIFVLPSRGNRELPEGVLARFDVFDGRGHFRRQVEIRCPGDPWNDRLVFLPGDRVIRQRRFVDAFVTSLGPGGLPETGEEGEEEATPAVICYRIVR